MAFGEAAMGAMLAQRAIPTATCDGCGGSVLRVFTTSQRPVVLDVEPVARGIYRLDEHNRAERRGLVELYLEGLKEGQPPSGFDVHECTPVAWYDR